VIRIELIAMLENKLYSIGEVCISKMEDVYFIPKTGSNDGFHISRHFDGKLHWKSHTMGKMSIRQAESIKDFKGIEFLGTTYLNLDVLSTRFNESKLKKCNGIFIFNANEYKDSMFNMTVAMLTEEGIQSLYTCVKNWKKGQIYIYTESNPIIGIIIYDAKQT
jgi:hypothetical protein